MSLSAWKGVKARKSEITQCGINDESLNAYFKNFSYILTTSAFRSKQYQKCQISCNFSTILGFFLRKKKNILNNS